MALTVEDFEAAGVDHLLEAAEQAVTDAIDGWSPNVAVISEPFAGRDIIMDHVEATVDGSVERITFDAVVDSLPEFGDADVVILDDCHYLYTREIGGFDHLDAFFEEILASDTLFVTSWNRYAWAYLVAVRDIDDVFATAVTVPSLAADQMADLLTSNYAQTMPTFVDTGAGGRVKTIGFDRRPVTFPGGLDVEVTVPELHLEYLTSRSLRADEAVTDQAGVVFQKIAELSNGNPGVATALWERSVRDGEIAPSYIEEVDQSLDIDDDEAFVLEVLLAKERLHRSTLAAVLGDIRVHRCLQSLTGQGVTRIDESVAVIDQEYLYTIDSHLRERRLIW